MLDKKRPFAEIFGSSDAKFEQDGKYFDAQGNPVAIVAEDDQDQGVSYGEELAAIKAELAELRAELDEIKSGKTVEAIPVDKDGNILDENGRKDDVDLESLDWREIKKMVIEQGGEWDNKTDGIAFLRSK